MGCTTSKKKEENTISSLKSTVKADELNGGLYLPGGFQASVVTEGVGPSRHIAVNSNGDKLKFKLILALRFLSSKKSKFLIDIPLLEKLIFPLLEKY